MQLVFGVLSEVARAAGAPEGTLGIVYGQQAGAYLVAHPAIRAVGCTGSVTGGPAGPDGDRVVDAMAEAIRGTDAQVLLNEGIAASYGRISDHLAEASGVQEIARGADRAGQGF